MTSRIPYETLSVLRVIMHGPPAKVGDGLEASDVLLPIVAFPKATTKGTHIDLAHHNCRLTASTEDPERLTYRYDSAVCQSLKRSAR
jgi:hypothetical protein